MIEVHLEPTLLLYLGATAGQVGWRLKRLLQQFYGDVPVWRSLWITAQLPADQEILSWFSEDERDGGDELASKLRAAADVLLDSKASAAVERLSNDALRYIIERPEDGGGTRIYIVFALSDDPGTPSAFDAAYLCRHLFQKTNPAIMGVSLLPSIVDMATPDAAQARRDGVRARTYAWLKKHESLLQRPSWRVQPPDGEPYETTALPFDLSYLVDLQNQGGARLQSMEDACDMVAQAIFLDIGSHAGRSLRGLNDTASPLRSTFKGRARAYSSLATASLVYPKDKVLGYCSASLAQTMLSEGLLAEADAAQAQASAAELTGRLELTDSAVLEALLRDRQVPLDGASAMREATSVPAIFQLSQEMEVGTSRGLQQLEPQIAGSASELLAARAAALEGEVAPLVINRGLPFARAVLGLLRAEVPGDQTTPEAAISLRGFRKRLEQHGASEEHLAKAREELRAAREGLGRLDEGFRQALRKALTPRAWRRDRDKARDALLRSMGEINRLSLALAAQRAAGSLCDQLAAKTETLRSRLEAVRLILCQAQATLRRTAEANLEPAAVAEGAFQLSLEAFDAAYIRRYYREHTQAPNPLMAYRDWATSLAGKTLEDLEAWKEAEITRQLLERTRVCFAQDLENISLLQAMDAHYGIQAPAMIESEFDRLLSHSQPFWQYGQDSGLQAIEGRVILGLEDAQSTLVPTKYRTGSRYELRFTGSRQRIDAVRTQHGTPAFLLQGVGDYRACYDRLRREGVAQLPAHPVWLPDVDVFPGRDVDARATFALAAALGYIVEVGGWHYWDPDREYVQAQVRPPRAHLLDQRRDWAEGAFVLLWPWVEQARKLAGENIAAMGPEEATSFLSECIRRYRELMSQMPADAALRQQYEREISILAEKRALLGTPELYRPPVG